MTKVLYNGTPDCCGLVLSSWSPDPPNFDPHVAKVPGDAPNVAAHTTYNA